jgi:glycosyltransferase involved in cell wall biosynthesis
MKILLLNANRVGVGTYHRALNFGRELARRGHEVTMMTVSNAHKFRSETRHDSEGFRIIECPNWLDAALPWGASGVLDILLRVREVWRGGYDVVYAFEYQPNISAPALLLRRLRKFVLVSDWCDWHAGASYHFGGYRWAHAIDRYFEEFIRHRADFVTTINRTLHDRAVTIGVPPERVAIVGEGVDPTYITPIDKALARNKLGLPIAVPLVASIRDADASAELLCRAVAASRHRNLHLLVIGSRPEPIRAFAESIGIDDRVLLPGRISDEDLPVTLAAADVLALPLEDNLINRGRWPHKLGDMLASQRPVIVSRAGEFPQLLEQRQCAVVVDYSPEAFTRAFDGILAAPADYVSLARRGRELIETELNWHVIGNQLEDVLHRAMSA